VSSLKFNNPTALGVGQEGAIFGHRASVVGRSVLKSGDGYRWDEYHLKLDDGTATTLVYESGIWKRFDLFDPDVTLSARDAADLGVGDPVTMRGSSAEITYVGQSRVAYIEGRAPEGYRVGSEAHYFNAEAGNRLFVVSWTGDEVEFYEGQNLPRGDVERAFGLPEQSLLARIFRGGSGGLDSWFDADNRLVGTILVAGAIFFFIWAQGASSEQTAEPPPAVPAPSLHLPGRAQGDLAGHHYVISGHQINEIDEMRGRFGRHEYDLVDEQGGHALLIQGLAWDARQWYLFGPASDSVRVSPNQAATLKQGSTFTVDGRPATVRALFMCRTIGSDGDVPPGLRTGSVRYGFTAQTRDGWVLARWNETDIEVRTGRILSEREVQQAFGRGVSG
jgi:hypothetical protein